jgi:ComF family protein
MLSLATLAIDFLGELLAPSSCAACDEPVPRRTLFCPGCAASVVRFGGAADHRAPFEYGGAIAIAIASFKYAGRADLGPRLGAMLAASALVGAGEIDLVAPVPLHPKRLADRGFNQAALLARPVARALSAPFAPRLLLRVRETARQASLTRAARRENVAGAFRSTPVDQRRVLLVDDVTTTGATLAACVLALRLAGAKTVVSLVLASRADA